MSHEAGEEVHLESDLFATTWTCIIYLCLRILLLFGLRSTAVVFFVRQKGGSTALG